MLDDQRSPVTSADASGPPAAPGQAGGSAAGVASHDGRTGPTRYPDPPTRPPNAWLVCNKTLDEGCTCSPWGPSVIEAIVAAKRLAGDL
jgi:hypothetical protein